MFVKSHANITRILIFGRKRQEKNYDNLYGGNNIIMIYSLLLDSKHLRNFLITTRMKKIERKNVFRFFISPLFVVKALDLVHAVLSEPSSRFFCTQLEFSSLLGHSGFFYQQIKNFGARKMQFKRFPNLSGNKVLKRNPFGRRNSFLVYRSDAKNFEAPAS